MLSLDGVPLQGFHVGHEPDSTCVSFATFIPMPIRVGYDGTCICMAYGGVLVGNFLGKGIIVERYIEFAIAKFTDPQINLS